MIIAISRVLFERDHRSATQIHKRTGDYEVVNDQKIRFHSGNVTGWSSLPIRFTAQRPEGPL